MSNHASTLPAVDRMRPAEATSCAPADAPTKAEARAINNAATAPRCSQISVLAPHYRSLAREIGIRVPASKDAEVATAEDRVPHTQLRQVLLSDPATAALLPTAGCSIALGGIEHAPFFLRRTGLMLLPPALLEDPAALGVAARWGLEALHAKNLSPLDERHLTRILRHGAALLAAAPTPTRNLLLDTLSKSVERELVAHERHRPGPTLLDWLARKIEGTPRPNGKGTFREASAIALEAPLEQLLVSGGDSRLALDPRTGANRYGVPPRPRPEAVHFSSSTASAISDYGFTFCDLLRRDMLASILRDGNDVMALRRGAIDTTANALLSLLGVAPEWADVAIAASGTDSELLAVMLSLAGAGERPLTNLLIAPEETGCGVKLAGAGRYFDDIAATGTPIRKDAPAWPDAKIEVVEIPMRRPDGAPRAIEDIDRAFVVAAVQALDAGGHVLAHVLASSKTGLSGPSHQAVETLIRLAPDRIDVVVDACQMRSDFGSLGALVECGWMVQISGSKFLTGPPFSGALIVPTALRKRADRASALLGAAPGVGRSEDWNAWWSERLPRNDRLGPPSFGPIFRWLPAILEARLLAGVPNQLRRSTFERFRTAIVKRLAESRWLRPIDLETLEPGGSEAADDFPRLSIVSFQVFGRSRNGALLPLDEPSCRLIFEMLNCDAVDRLGELPPTHRALAAQPAHIGQPVTLKTERGPLTVLRMVLGARFFTIVGYAGPSLFEAALESEISDALRAIDKLELLASHWWRLSETDNQAA